jgi:hypothetical protein
MATLSVANMNRESGSGYLAPTCDALGDITSTLFHPENYSLWEVAADLCAGAKLQWSRRHGDEVLYILDGSLEINGLICLPKTAVFVEADVEAQASALTAMRALHFGPRSITPPTDGMLGRARSDGHRVHSVGFEDAVLFGTPGASRGGRYYSDSTCDTCRAYFLEYFDTDGKSEVNSHAHSQDEIIHILSGELRVGRLKVGPGQSIAIPGNYRYGFHATGPLSFVNYRRDASTIISKPGDVPLLETLEGLRQRHHALD